MEKETKDQATWDEVKTLLLNERLVLLATLIDHEPSPLLDAIFFRLFIHDMITRPDNATDVWLALNLHSEYYITLHVFEYDMRVKHKLYKQFRRRRNKSVFHRLYHRIADHYSGNLSLTARLIRFIAGVIIVTFMIALGVSLFITDDKGQSVTLVGWLSKIYSLIFTGI